MFTSSFLLALAPFLSLISAAPYSFHQRRANTCGTNSTSILEPAILQALNESSPNTIYESTQHEGGQVTIYQNVGSTAGGIQPKDRLNTVIGFGGIPETAYDCQLNFYVPSYYPISTTPTGSAIPPLDIYTFGVNQLGNESASGQLHDWTWSSVSQFNNPPPEYFGTITLQHGVTQVVKSVTCPFEASGGLSNTVAFEMQIAFGLVDVEAGVGYNWDSPDPAGVGLVGFYLSYEC